MEKDERKYGSVVSLNKARAKSNDKNIHAGHRARLLELITKAGIDNVSDVQAVEGFLSYIFPRGDVNPLAHRLLNKFETFTHIVEASVEDLMTVQGINKRSACMISLFSDYFYLYSTARMGKKTVISNRAELVDLVEDHLRFSTTENILLFALSASNIITHKRRFGLDMSGQVSITPLEFSNFISSSKPASLVVAHNHPFGTAKPSSEDGNAYSAIENICNVCGVNFIDSFIVGEDGVYSQREEKMLRTYFDIEGLKDAFISMRKS